MSNQILRERYNEKGRVIKKLNELLKSTPDKFQRDALKESIRMVKKEQDETIKTMRKNNYKNISKDAYKSLMSKSETTKVVFDAEEKKSESKEDKKVSDRFIADEISYIRKNCDSMSIKELSDKLGKPPKLIEYLIKELDIKPSISKDAYRTAKIIFDGGYNLFYDNGKRVYRQKIDQNLLDSNYTDTNSVYNFNIIKMLKDFDHENKTNLYTKYMNNELNVVYDFLNPIHDLTISEKERKKNFKKVAAVAKREAQAFDNIKVLENDRNKRFRTGMVAVATAGLVLLGGLGIGNFSSKKSHSSPATKVESSLVVTTTENITIEDIPIKEKNADEEIVTEKIEIKETEKEEEKNTDFVISSDDTFTFNDPVDFYYASTDNSPVGSSKKLEGYKYKECSISVVYENKCIMQISDGSQINLDELERRLEEEYNGDVQIFVNFNLFDKETGEEKLTDHVAWVRYEDIKGKGLVLTK